MTELHSSLAATELPHSLPVEEKNLLVVNQFRLKPLVELLSSASSVDFPFLVDSLVSGLAALLFLLFPFRFIRPLSLIRYKFSFRPRKCHQVINESEGEGAASIALAVKTLGLGASVSSVHPRSAGQITTRYRYETERAIHKAFCDALREKVSGLEVWMVLRLAYSFVIRAGSIESFSSARVPTTSAAILTSMDGYGGSPAAAPTPLPGRKSGWLHVALYLKQCAASLQKAYAGDKIEITEADLFVQFYLSFFSLSKIIVLAKRVRKSTLTSIISPVDDIEAVTEVVSDMKGCLKDLMLPYVPRVRDIPLYQGMSFDPTWKALPTHRLTREVLQKRAKQPKSKKEYLLRRVFYELTVTRRLLSIDLVDALSAKLYNKGGVSESTSNTDSGYRDLGSSRKSLALKELGVKPFYKGEFCLADRLIVASDVAFDGDLSAAGRERAKVNHSEGVLLPFPSVGVGYFAAPKGIG
ncbi:hypothetical protein Tco_1504998 [Tanacetum coccineum]